MIYYPVINCNPKFGCLLSRTGHVLLLPARDLQLEHNKRKHDPAYYDKCHYRVKIVTASRICSYQLREKVPYREIRDHRQHVEDEHYIHHAALKYHRYIDGPEKKPDRSTSVNTSVRKECP